MTTNVTTKENEVLFTRKQYLDNECTHDQYYGQFVTEHTINTVLSYFSKEKLVQAYAENEHLNSIKLAVWDSIPLYAATYKMKACGDYLTKSGHVSILKRAARMIIESTNL